MPPEPANPAVSPDTNPALARDQVEASERPAATDSRPCLPDEPEEKTIDDILRELTGQRDFPEADPLGILIQASGDYTRDHAIEQAMLAAQDRDGPLPPGLHAQTGCADITDMDEFETHLDLAKVYVDMGDIETARNLLLDVQARGTPGQREEATEWLKGCVEPERQRS